MHTKKQSEDTPYYLKNKQDRQNHLKTVKFTPLKYFLILNICGLIYLGAIWKYQTALDHQWVWIAFLFGGFLIVLPVVILSVFGLIYGFYKLRAYLTATNVSQRQRKHIYWLILANLLIYVGLGIAANKLGPKQAVINRHRVYQMEIKPSAQKKLTKLFHQNGFPGKIKIISSERDFKGLVRVNKVKYEYTETVAGHPFHFYDSVAFDDDGDFWQKPKLFSNPPAQAKFDTEDADTDEDNGDPAFIAEMPYLQPQVQKQFSLEKKKLNKQLPQGYRVSSIVGTINSDCAKQDFKALQTQVVKNHQAGLPMGGFYNVDVKQFAQKEALMFLIQIDAPKLNNKQQQELLKKIDFAGFWDGKYEFDFVKKDTVSSEILTIKAGRLIKITDY